MRIYNQTKKTIVAERAKLADTFIARMVGLLNRSALSLEEALVITHCQSIHMFFMGFPIDVIFVDKKNIVVGLVKNIKPFQLSPIFFKASCAIELAVGTIEQSKTLVGDQVILQDF